MQNPSAPTIILASSSPYRRGLLDRFLDQFETVEPDIDESNGAGLSPGELASASRPQESRSGRDQVA